MLFLGQKVQSLASLVSSISLAWLLPREGGEEGTENLEQRGMHTEIYSGLTFLLSTEDLVKEASPPQTSYLAELHAFWHADSFPHLWAVWSKDYLHSKKKKKEEEAWIPPKCLPGTPTHLFVPSTLTNYVPSSFLLIWQLTTPFLRCFFTLFLGLVSRFCPASLAAPTQVFCRFLLIALSSRLWKWPRAWSSYRESTFTL